MRFILAAGVHGTLAHDEKVQPELIDLLLGLPSRWTVAVVTSESYSSVSQILPETLLSNGIFSRYGHVRVNDINTWHALPSKFTIPCWVETKRRQSLGVAFETDKNLWGDSRTTAEMQDKVNSSVRTFMRPPPNVLSVMLSPEALKHFASLLKYNKMHGVEFSNGYTIFEPPERNIASCMDMLINYETEDDTFIVGIATHLDELDLFDEVDLAVAMPSAPAEIHEAADLSLVGDDASAILQFVATLGILSR